MKRNFSYKVYLSEGKILPETIAFRQKMKDLWQIKYW